jgi:hypothetical protein
MSQTTEIYDKTMDAAQQAFSGCSAATIQQLNHPLLESRVRSICNRLTAGQIEEEEAMLRAHIHGALAGLNAFYARRDQR